MPASRITIATNAKQSQRAPLLIPELSATTEIKSLVFKAAQTKLRIKKPSRIFVSRTGQELLSEEDWRDTLRNDIILLVSVGEDYVGVKKQEINGYADVNANCPLHVLASSASVESLALTQFRVTAQTLPGIIHAAAQPDLCPGTKHPVGAVFASKKWVHPPLIGSDIGCGMAWYKTTLSRKQVDGDRGKRIAEKLRGLEGPWRDQIAREQWLSSDAGVSCSAGEEWDSALGTIGAGNHFAEVQVVEELSLDHVDLHRDDVVLLVHSGSRGYGGNILKRYASESHVSLEEGSTTLSDYMKDHDTACRWAKANRDLIALRFLACLEPGDDDWGLGKNSAESTESEALSRAKEKIKARKMVDIWHNNVEKVSWPPGPTAANSTANNVLDASSSSQLLGNADADHVYVHRKGAAPVYDPGTGSLLPIVPLPGSRGTPTLIMKPLVSESNSWGLGNALSLAHGSGRSMSRTKALSSLGQKYRGQNILEPRAGGEGTWVICDEKDLVFEEAPDAYKDVHEVGDDLVKAGVAEIVGKCTARVSYKVRIEAR